MKKNLKSSTTDDFSAVHMISCFDQHHDGSQLTNIKCSLNYSVGCSYRAYFSRPTPTQNVRFFVCLLQTIVYKLEYFSRNQLIYATIVDGRVTCVIKAVNKYIEPLNIWRLGLVFWLNIVLARVWLILICRCVSLSLITIRYVYANCYVLSCWCLLCDQLVEKMPFFSQYLRLSCDRKCPRMTARL